MNKTFIKILFIFVIHFFIVNNVCAGELIGVDTDTSFQSFTSCSDNYKAAWYNRYDMGYRFTIIDEKNNNKKVNNTISVTYFHNYICPEILNGSCNENVNYSIWTDDGPENFYIYDSVYFTHMPFKSAVNYFNGYKYDLSSSSTSCIDCISRTDLGGYQYVGPNGISNLNQMLDKLTDSDDNLFKTIMTETKIGVANFFAREYTILIEPVYLIAYQEKSKMYFFAGTASEIAKYVYNNSPKTNCLQVNFVPNLAKNVCMGTSCNITIKSKKDYLDDIFNYSGLGMTLIRSRDIPQSNAILTIEKQDSNLQTITGKSAVFRIYSDSNCQKLLANNNTVQIDAGGTGSISLPKNNTYYYKETLAPTEYDIDNTCRSIYLDKNQKVVVLNRKSCSSDFKSKLVGGLTISERFDLFDTWNFRNLLNFNLDSAEEATTACSNPICSSTPTSGCISGGLESNFNQNNLSCYDRTTDIDGKIAFCKVSFNISNNLGLDSFPTVKAGTLLLNRDEEYKTIATGEIKETCYTLFDGNSNTLETGWYDDYITDEKLSLSEDGVNQIEVEYSDDPVLSGPTSVESGLNKYEITYRADYNLLEWYSEFGSGEIMDYDCIDCRYLGYGIYSKLVNNGIYNYEVVSSQILNSQLMPLYYGKLNFSYKYDGNIFNGECNYSLKNELLPHPSTGSNLNLEFRTFQYDNAFPGKEGDGRIVGSNWCYGDDCNSTNSLIANIMNNRNNSYNKMNSKPLYRIVLNSSIIKSIREYNKINPYDDNYNLICDDNNKCKSKFLEDYGFTRTIEKIQWLDDYESI